MSFYIYKLDGQLIFFKYFN